MSKMSIISNQSNLIVIPARLGSTRLAEKPLLKETGKYLIQHVYEQACLSKKAKRVVIATDDQRILDACNSFGAEAMMTRADHPSGTDRVAEVARAIDCNLVVNLQGDEPQVAPESLDLLFELLEKNPQAPMATLATPIPSVEAFQNPNCVKVVVDDEGRALYFSRSPIPYFREGVPEITVHNPKAWQHLGLYGYRKDFLLGISQIPPHPLELAEKLEQLRVLAKGVPLMVGKVLHTGIGIDTPEDYRAFVRSQLGIHEKLAARAA